MTGETWCSEEKKNQFCMNILAEKPRFPSKSLEQSKKKLLKICSCSCSKHLLEAELDLWDDSGDVKIK